MVNRRMFTLAFAAAVFVVSACGGKSFVDGFEPTYTSSPGTSASGDYFPLVAGRTATFAATGAGTISQEVTVDGETTSSTESLDQDLSYTTEILAPTALMLPSGTYEVFPERSGQTGNTSASNWYESLPEGVNVRATSALGGAAMEVERGLLLRRPLVVGDSWERTYDATLGVASEDAAVTSRVVVHVTGVGTATFEGRQVSTVTVVEVSESSLRSSTVTSSGTNDRTVVYGEGVGILSVTGTAQSEATSVTSSGRSVVELSLTLSATRVEGGAATAASTSPDPLVSGGGIGPAVPISGAAASNGALEAYGSTGPQLVSPRELASRHVQGEVPWLTGAFR